MIYFFFGYVFFEVLVSVEIAGMLGGVGTFLEIMLSGMIGIALLTNVKTTMAESFQAMSNNCITMKEFQELNIFALLGAVLLILPGVLSDIIGVLMQFSVFTTMIITRYNKMKNTCNPKQGEDNVIDAEIIDNDTSLR